MKLFCNSFKMALYDNAALRDSLNLYVLDPLYHDGGLYSQKLFIPQFITHVKYTPVSIATKLKISKIIMV